MRSDKLIWVWMFAVIFSGVGLAKESLRQEEFDPNFYLAPLHTYTRTGRSLALRYQGELVYMLERIHRELKHERFEIMGVNNSPKGGAGFWLHPEILTPEARFLGVVAKISICLPYFPDTNGGRLSDALDAFGKDLFKIMGDTLEQIPDPSVKGIVVVLIYSKKRINDPAFLEQAEGSVIFISRENLKKFNSFQLTLHKLFEKSDGYYFQGKDQIQVLLNYFLRG